MNRPRRWLPLAACLLAAACAPEPAPPLNVLVVSIDTLRGDRLGCNGYERDTTPRLDRLASEHAVRFARAVAESPWTLPSHVTMLSGLHPLTHGVRQPDEAPGPGVTLLAERLADTHYTFAVTDGGWVAEPWGFDAGFASFDARDRDVTAAVREVIDFVRHRRPRGPWFGFLHTFDVHCPYDPPEPWAGRFQSPDAEPIEVAGRCGNPHFNAGTVTPGQAVYLSDRYDDDVRRVDDAIGRLLDLFDELDLWRDTVLVVTSDHGDEFLEHGSIGHERTLERESLDVPLLIAAPGVAPRVVAGPVGLADVVPTVLDLLGRPAADLDGLSLVPAMRGDERALEGRTILSDLAWQANLAAVSSVDASRAVDLERLPEGLERGLLERREELLRDGLRARKLEGSPRAAELRELGY